MDPQNVPILTEAEKGIQICDAIHHLQMTPKKFINGFLTNADPQIAYRRRFWGTSTGSSLTHGIIQAVKAEVASKGRRTGEVLRVSNKEQTFENRLRVRQMTTDRRVSNKEQT
ncbi:uncharacterized protein PGTG_21031 [Puccinia graminis f. sp. tritici CRL 75-36-700-3]|uniref:Uncharacterized protein n=1 Tax=Puccinia graminis f. sp. tritici (strain CRL 75-36-700-3 / race SCCL) TaxID=418459 RepID=H6QQ69_PUCGT|nr:uncharacterized protein PGTG_21031 [Puccinia graminis f. sp. tritici CRL 75-36-700-3]EHS64681.1 hypothetical protein PGTG_21031 [Puccinia graminis f. sp. tritici CRL 75-36-700-3]